jgi:hypothetical protein
MNTNEALENEALKRVRVLSRIRPVGNKVGPVRAGQILQTNY